MSASVQKALSEIRCGKFVAKSNNNFAWSFLIYQVRNGVKQPVFMMGSMPVLVTRWAGVNGSEHRQSLN